MVRILALLGAFVALALAPSVSAQSLAQKMETLDMGDPAKVAAALQREGYRAVAGTDEKTGKPFITSAANGNAFTINFFECEAGTKCKSMEFTSWWKKEDFFSPALVNEWNAKKRFLKVVIDQDGDLVMYMDTSTIGVVSGDFFADTVDWYVQMDAALTKFLDEKRQAAKTK